MGEAVHRRPRLTAGLHRRTRGRATATAGKPGRARESPGEPRVVNTRATPGQEGTSTRNQRAEEGTAIESSEDQGPPGLWLRQRRRNPECQVIEEAED